VEVNRTEAQMANKRFNHYTFDETQASDKLSRAASLVRREILGGQQCDHDIAIFHAPRECGTVMWSGVKRRVREGLAELGYTPEQFVRECEERTSAKFVYFSELSFAAEM